MQVVLPLRSFTPPDHSCRCKCNRTLREFVILQSTLFSALAAALFSSAAPLIGLGKMQSCGITPSGCAVRRAATAGELSRTLLMCNDPDLFVSDLHRLPPPPSPYLLEKALNQREKMMRSGILLLSYQIRGKPSPRTPPKYEIYQ